MTNNTNIYKSVFMGFQVMEVGDVHHIEPPEGKLPRQFQSELLTRIRHWKRAEGKNDYVFTTTVIGKEVVLTRTA